MVIGGDWWWLLEIVHVKLHQVTCKSQLVVRSIVVLLVMPNSCQPSERRVVFYCLLNYFTHLFLPAVPFLSTIRINLANSPSTA
jgi:hypothetical protein